MKTYTEEMWYETNKDGTISLGFTQDFIRRKMPECFHVVQADVKNAKKDDPLLVLETNDCLESIKSPVTGVVRHFNHKARDFPDQLKETDVILTIAPPGLVGVVGGMVADPWKDVVPQAAPPLGPDWDDFAPLFRLNRGA